MENNELIQTDFALPLCRFICRENGEFVEKTTRDLFYKKRAVVFGLPGAFTPTCTTSQVPDYEAAYDDLIASNDSEIPNDIQVMINNNEKGAALLRIVEVIGQDKLERIDEDTIYFIINTLNQLNIDLLRNKILIKVLPLKV